MIKIPDTPNSQPAGSECEHLSPIVKLLEENGNKPDRNTGVLHDKGDGNFLVFDEPIDTCLIRKNVLIPKFIKILENEYVFCERCWFTLEQKKKDKIYGGSKQIKW